MLKIRKTSALISLILLFTPMLPFAQETKTVEEIEEGSDEIRIAISDEALSDLQYRLSHTRWPDQINGAEWEYGTNKEYLQSLVTHWSQEYEWREAERWINSFHHYKTQIDGQGIHYIHAKSEDENAIPLLILHGWPSSFVQMLELVPLLTNPEQYNLEGPSFHVVVASLPGFGFSDSPDEPGMNMERIGELMSHLMTQTLGYSQYGARGSDLGGTVIDQIARQRPEELLGIHLTGLIVTGAPVPPNATEAEKNFLEAGSVIAANELAYARLHMSKPQTLAYGLNDSPVGLAAWIVEKYHKWGDTHGDIESRFSKNYLLTTLSIYWFSETINASVRTYYEMGRNRGSSAYINVPTGFLMSHQDMFPYAPKEWAERGYNVVHWSETYEGGHFLEWEEPELVAKDLQDFFSSL